MNDSDFLQAFEAGRIPPDEWNHRAHVRMAYLYIRDLPFDVALNRIRAGIQQLNAVHQTPEALDRGYHETMTQAFARLIHSAQAQCGLCESAEEFCERHPELLDKRLLLRFYSRDCILSWAAKSNYLEPDLAPFSSERLSDLSRERGVP